MADLFNRDECAEIQQAFAEKRLNQRSFEKLVQRREEKALAARIDAIESSLNARIHQLETELTQLKNQ